MHLRTTLAAALLLLTPLAAQGSAQILVDLGTDQFPSTGTGGTTWNDIVSASAPPFTLLDSSNQSTGILWTFSSTLFVGSNSAGTASPQAGSGLAAFPPSATRDVMYGQGSATVVIELSQLAPDQLLDFTFGASRMNVNDNRATEYVVQGFNASSVTLDPANNVSETVSINGILPDASGAITISVRAAPANTNSSRFFYLGAMEITATSGGGIPQILGFDRPDLAASRAQSKGAFTADLTVLESTGATPAVTLVAIDESTGQAPTWMSIPPTATAGTPFSLSFDPGAVALGAHTANVTAQATGYPDATIRASFSVHSGARKNLLFYGNSYSQGNGGVHTWVNAMALEAGHPDPHELPQLVGGQNLNYHLNNPTQAAAISNLPLGEEWDVVVMQGHSLEATNVFGNPTAFRNNAVAITSNVRAHSPSARAVLYQTWARGPGAFPYPGSYPTPLAMHNDIRANYRAAAADINTAFGPGTAHVAAAGDTVALLAFDTSLYTADLSHPTAPTTLMASLALYQAIYRERSCDMTPDFDGGSPLATKLGQHGLGATAWRALSGIGERVADLEIRRLPGSSEDLLLRTGVNGPPSACPRKAVTLGQQVSISLTTPNGLYAKRATVLMLDVFVTGTPPIAQPPFPEVHFLSPLAVAMATAPQLGTGLLFDAPLPATAPGLSLLVQGVAVGPSVERGNLFFTTSDAHELELR